MKLDLEHCVLCGNAVVYEVGRTPVCAECQSEERELYSQIRQFLRDYPHVRMDVQELADHFKVSKKKVQFLIDNDFIQTSSWIKKDDD